MNVLKKIYYRLTGRDSLEDRLNTLYHIVSIMHKASDIPVTSDPELRILQKCDALMLRIVDKIFKRNNIDYWIDFGTLLGAVRHKGFIPWDDDIDLSAHRKDFNKIREVLYKELSPYGFNIYENKRYPGNNIGFGYRFSETGIWLDIFPVDNFVANHNKSFVQHSINNKYKRFKIYYQLLRYCMSEKSILRFEKYIFKDMTTEGIKYLYHCPEPGLYLNPFIGDTNDVYPLSVVEFEGSLFPAPNSSNEYLKNYYGNDYMEIPRTGALHHSGLSLKAKDNNVNMNLVYNTLEKVLKDI